MYREANMKFLILLLSISLLSCTVEIKQKKQYSDKIPMYHECNELVELGYAIDMDACIKHIDTPKFKYGEFRKIDGYAKGCKVQVQRPTWGVRNSPYYFVSIYCPDVNGKFTQMNSNFDTKAESELK